MAKATITVSLTLRFKLLLNLAKIINNDTFANWFLSDVKENTSRYIKIR